MEPIHTIGSTRRRRRPAPPASTLPAAPIAPARTASFGYADVALPEGSRRLGPVQPGEQGISTKERPHAERAITRLFEAPGVDMVALYDRETNLYELRSRTGVVRWERWGTPDGEIRYRVVHQSGENPIPNVDGTILRTLEEEAAAAGGVGKPVPKERNAYPDILGRIAQLWDNARAPEFVYIPTPGGDPNHPGAGSHGIPDIVQSRSPLVIAGPGIARGAVADGLVRHEDIAPTVAELLGVRQVLGTNATGIRRQQLLKWQDGNSLVAGITDSRLGARMYGAAERAVIFTIDGLSQSVLLDEIRAGRLPNMARILARGTLFKNGSLAQYPTVTWANHNTIVTGASPGHNGLVNNSWFDRTTQQEQLITDGGFKNVFRTGRLMEPQVETIYEAVERSFPDARTVAVNQPSGRGADLSVLDLTGFGGVVANIARIGASFLGIRRLGDPEMEGSVDEWKGEAIKDAFGTALGDVLWSKDTPPKLGVFEYTLVDNRGHLVGPHTEDARRALRAVDRQVGVVLDRLDKRGIAGSTAVVLTADHGMEHQERDVAKAGGWFEALDRAKADGAHTKESTRFVYVRSVDWSVEGVVPKLGTSGVLAIRVRNDDTDAAGSQPPIAGATVTVTDADGGEWIAVTDADGLVRLPIAPKRGPLRVQVQHANFSRELGTIDLPRR